MVGTIVGSKGEAVAWRAPGDAVRAGPSCGQSTLPSRWAQQGGWVCQFLLGLVQKNPNKEVGIRSPLLDAPDPTLASPPYPSLSPQTLPWSRDAMMGQEQSKDWAWGREWEGVRATAAALGK